MPDCAPAVCGEGFAVRRRAVQSLKLSGKVFLFALLLSSISSMAQEQKLAFGNLRPMKISVVKDGFTLNGISLDPVKVESAKQVSLDLATPDKVAVRLHFLPTVKIANGQPRLKVDEAALTEYQKQFPKVTEVLGYKDAIGALKPITFELRKGPEVIELFEETLLLFSSNRDDIPKMRKVTLHQQALLLSTNKLAAQPMDIQYRGLSHPAPALDTQGTLQMLYVRRGPAATPEVLGVFLICSRPNGDFEYYKLPAERLDAILDPEDALISPNRERQLAGAEEKEVVRPEATAADKTLQNADKARM